VTAALPPLSVDQRLKALADHLLGVTEEIERLAEDKTLSLAVRWELAGAGKLAVRSGFRLTKAADGLEASRS
jgi:hypothetical protein